MENQPCGWFSPLLPFVQCLRFGCRTPGDAHGIRSRGTDSPIPAPTAHPQSVRPQFRQGTKEKTVPKDGLFMSGHWPREFRSLRRAIIFFILVDFPSRGIGKIKGDFAVCGRRPAYAAGPRRVADPDPLVACGRELVRTFPLLTSWEPEPRCRPYTAGAPSGW